MPSLSQNISKDSPLHRRILEACRARINLSRKEFSQRHADWIEAEKKYFAYLPERETDAARRVNRDQGGKPEYTTIVMPYTYSVVMTSHTYWTTVLMSRDPVLQFTGRHGEAQQSVQAVEAMIAYQVQVGRHMAPYYCWGLDAGKYGVGVLGQYWELEETNVSRIVEQSPLQLGNVSLGKPRKVRITERVKGYEGNKVFNIRPYDLLPDPRVSLMNYQDGEFLGIRIDLGWSQILRRQSQGYYFNIDELRKRPARRSEREQGSPPVELPSDDNGLFLSSTLKDTNTRELYELYVDLIPSEWGLGSSSYPEKWCFTLTTDYALLIGASPLGAYHNRYPVSLLIWEPDPYSVNPRTPAEVIDPIQRTMDWLINSHFYNVRKVLNDQFVVDPSRVMMKDVSNPLPGGIIRLKPRGYGQNPAEAIKQLGVVDITRSHLEDMKYLMEFGQRVHGVNDQIMGLLAPSGRRTAQEIRTSSSFGVNRLKTNSEFFGAMGWQDNAMMMVQNTQQYYDDTKKFRLVGDLALTASNAFLDITPETIQGFYDFVPVDGNLPIDRFAQANLWREIFFQLRQMPEIMQQYDIGKMFSWVAQLAGLKNINQFRIAVVPDAAAAAAAQRGNIVPLGGPNAGGSSGPGGGSSRDLSRVSEPGQVSGLGTTG